MAASVSKTSSDRFQQWRIRQWIGFDSLWASSLAVMSVQVRPSSATTKFALVQISFSSSMRVCAMNLVV